MQCPSTDLIPLALAHKLQAPPRLLQLLWGIPTWEGCTFAFLLQVTALPFFFPSPRVASDLLPSTAEPLGSVLPAAHTTRPEPVGAPHLEHIWRQAWLVPSPAVREQRASCRLRGAKLLPNLSRGAARRKACVCLTTEDFEAGWGEAESCLSSHR